MNWQISKLLLPLKFTWAISRGSSNEKTNFFVKIEDEGFTGIGEVAGITKNRLDAEIIPEQWNSLQNLHGTHVTSQNLSVPDSIMSSLRFGVESALVHLEAQKNQKTVSQYLGLNEYQPRETSFSLPIMEPSKLKSFIEEYSLQKFSVIKIKVGKSQPLETVLEVAQNHPGELRIDANEAFDSAELTMQFIENLPQDRVQFIEQPLPAENWKEAQKLKEISPLPIIADESLQTQDIDQQMADCFHGVNIKLMKSGGYYNAVRQLQTARKLGLKTMLGCMVETSLGISSALHISANVDWLDLDGFLFFKKDPFQIVQEREGRLYLESQPFTDVSI